MVGWEMKLIKTIGRRPSKSGKSSHQWGLFLCENCGNEVERVLGKSTKTCGCGTYSLRRRKHGGIINLKPTRLYRVWHAMKSRCMNPNNDGYKWYGGRGIKVCEQWADGFVEFEKWCLENGYKEDLQLDRIDNNGDYSPENCHFVTPSENSRNSKGTKLNIEDVILMRDLHNRGQFNYVQLGKLFGVSYQQARRVSNGTSWVEMP
jgi:hypothetical protein